MAGRSVTIVEQRDDEGQKWYRGLEKVQSYFNTPFRDRWDRKLEFILSCVGYCIGFGNIWRYPYVVYANGGSAFIIPYLIILAILALPIFYFETLLGQFSGCNPIEAFNFAPVWKGIGIGMLFINFWVSIYYVIYLVYSTRYLFATFQYELPWTKCNREWADERCFVRTAEPRTLRAMMPSCEVYEETRKNYTPGADCVNYQPPSEQYWIKAILREVLTDAEKKENYKPFNLWNIGDVQWDMVLILLLTWAIQFLNLIRGIKSSGKVVYFTAIFPFIVLIIMLIFTLTMDGASDGLEYLFYVKDWSKIGDPAVWRAAITQCFYSTGVGFGCLILYSSFNDFSYKIQRMTILIVALDAVASILSAMTVFSILGYLAKLLKRKVSSVVASGPDLLFKTIPEALGQMPVPHLWAILYFIMLYTVGIDSLAVICDTLITTIYEMIPRIRKHQGKFRALCFFILFLLTIPLVTRGGFHVATFIDTYSAENTLIFLGLCEIVAMMYTYGIRNFTSDVQFMTGKGVNLFWKLCWLILVPIMLIILLFLGLFTSQACDSLKEREIRKELKNELQSEKDSATGFCVFGWIISLTVILPVFIVAIVQVIRYRKKTGNWESSLKPNNMWGPRDPLIKVGYLDWQAKRGEEFGEHTTQTMDELKADVTSETPDVKSAAEKRVAERRLSIFRRFSNIFQPGALEELEAENKEKKETKGKKEKK